MKGRWARVQVGLVESRKVAGSEEAGRWSWQRRDAESLDIPEGLVQHLRKVPDGEEHEADMDVVVTVGCVEPLGLDVVHLEHKVRRDPTTTVSTSCQTT